MQVLTFSTTERRQILDISNEVAHTLPKTGSGIATIFTPHTGAALTTANLDPGTDLDFIAFLEAITPQLQWRHPHDPRHAPDHLLASIIGPSVGLPYEDGRLLTGAWQHMVSVELDGPRERNVIVGT